jgi:ABC-type transporter Mla subunit MlaD
MSTNNLFCDCNPCQNIAIINCTWGSDKSDTQSANLCKEHLDDLYSKINPLLKAMTNNIWLICGEVK